jgi:internalin A
LALLGASDVTDAGMAPLALLPDLKSLEIYVAPKLTGHGLKKLGPRLADLEILVMNRTGITEESMACLRDCRKLKSLAFLGAKYGDAGLAHLGQLESLTLLTVGSTEVTDGGLQALSGLRNLRTLNLTDTKITGTGLAHLSGLHDLESLDLSSTPIRDEGLDEILKLKGLKTLQLQFTNVSPRAVAKLQAARPSLRIYTN